jgi:hypothetical protein
MDIIDERLAHSLSAKRNASAAFFEDAKFCFGEQQPARIRDCADFCEGAAAHEAPMPASTSAVYRARSQRWHSGSYENPGAIVNFGARLERARIRFGWHKARKIAEAFSDEKRKKLRDS